MTELQSMEPLIAEITRRSAENPLDALSGIRTLRRALHEQEREAVFGALETHSWREIGEALGVSKQAAFQRFGIEWALMTKERLPKGEWKRTVEDRLTR